MSESNLLEAIKSRTTDLPLKPHESASGIVRQDGEDLTDWAARIILVGQSRAEAIARQRDYAEEAARRLRAAVEYLTPLMGRQATAMETVQMVAAEFRRMRQHLEGESIVVSDPATPEDLEGRMSDRSIPPYQIGQG